MQHLRTITGHAAALAVGYYLARAAHRFVGDLVVALDGALDLDDLSDDDACVCGSTGHKEVRYATIVTEGYLENPPYGSMPLVIEFWYYDIEPLAVYMTMTADIEVAPGRMQEDTQTWQYGRDILDTAVSRTDQSIVGEGDVKASFNPETDTLCLHLAGNGTAHVFMHAAPVRDFLAGTFHLVPSGTETPDVDTAIEKLLAGTWEQ